MELTPISLQQHHCEIQFWRASSTYITLCWVGKSHRFPILHWEFQFFSAMVWFPRHNSHFLWWWNFVVFTDDWNDEENTLGPWHSWEWHISKCNNSLWILTVEEMGSRHIFVWYIVLEGILTEGGVMQEMGPWNYLFLNKLYMLAWWSKSNFFAHEFMLQFSYMVEKFAALSSASSWG